MTGEKKQPSDPDSMPPKTMWAVIWFTVLGLGALVWQFGLSQENHLLGSSDGGLDMMPQFEHPGPLPPPPSPSLTPAVSLDKQDQSAGLAPLRVPHQAIEDPGDSAMCRFYNALEDVERQKGDAVTRILHYGDSILTSDKLSGIARRFLQHRFGDGGHGFVLLGKPWEWYHHLDVKHGAKGDWRPRPLTSDPVADGMFGLGGVAFETRSNDARAWAGTVPRGPVGTRVASFDVSYLAQPRGGSFDLILNGQLIKTIDTDAATKHTAHHRVRVSPGPAKLVLRTHGNGRMRVFGAVLESGEPGVVYDSLAINGARASNLNRFDPHHWTSELRHRRANLVVLMFGANEGHNKYLPLDDYRREFTAVLQTIRQGAPESACLIVGPLDQAKRQRDGRLASRQMPHKLSKLQRDVSLNQGCAFFNTLEAMGGQNSMARWRRTGLGGGDLIHPTPQGARRIGTWLADALIAGYENYLIGGKKCASSVTSL